MSLKRTPLFDKYPEHGGKIVEFGGFEMPIQFETSLTDEHNRVREFAGLFDVSHMGEIIVTGKDSVPFLNYILTNDVSKMKIGRVIYTFMCNENGGVVDDFMVYKIAEDNYALIVNASNTEKDFQWIKNLVGEYEVNVDDITARIGQLALQGPKSLEILEKLSDDDIASIPNLAFVGDFEFGDNCFKVAGKPCLISKTGYTGEDGYEIYCKAEDTAPIWDAILATEIAGEKPWPIGLGARDTLRFEAGLPLYGNEMKDDIPVVYLGMNFAIKFNKDDFVGKKALEEAKANPKQKLVGFELTGKGVPRQGYEIVDGDEVIGEVTTGYIPPTIQKPIGNAYVNVAKAVLGETITVMLRKRPVEATIISNRFLDNK